MKEFKGAWHKVADGDFPELEELVLIACRIEDGDLETTIGYLREYNVYKQIYRKHIHNYYFHLLCVKKNHNTNPLHYNFLLIPYQTA